MNLIVGNVEDAIPTGDENRVSLGVCLSLLLMNPAVHLNDEARGVAIEIYDEAAKYVLASDVQIVQLVTS